jgi:hypothetical protein
VGPDWAELRFAGPGAWLRRGFNDVELAFTASQAAPRPGRRARDVAAALDWIAFERGGAR